MLKRLHFMSGAFLLLAAIAFAEEAKTSPPYRIDPKQLGLPAGSKRSSEPFVTRIYKMDDFGNIQKKQPAGYPFTPQGTYTLKGDEAPLVHQGVDFTSRPQPNEAPVPLDFKAGDDPWGTIAVQSQNGALRISSKRRNLFWAGRHG